MRVLLISANREEMDMRVPALGLAGMAPAIENAGHTAQLLDLIIETRPRDAVRHCIRCFKPDVIGMSVRNIDDQCMHNPRFLLDQAGEAVTWCRENATGVPIVLGGAGFSILPRQIMDYLGAELGIQGEGEAVFPELLERLQAGKPINGLPGLIQAGDPGSARRRFLEDLDTIAPLPDPHLLAASLTGAEDAPVPVQSRRGCPLACSYCSTPLIEGVAVRRRSPEAVVDWMARWVREGFRHFYFVDNTFNLPESYARDLCRGILAAKLKISWRCILYPGGLTPETVELMAQAGCAEVSLGFESGSIEMLQRMHKQFTVDDVLRAAQLLRRHRIRSMGFLLLGGPGETMNSAKESLDVAAALPLDALKITIGVRIYPGTGVAHQALAEGVIKSEEDLLRPRFYFAEGLEDLNAAATRRANAHRGWLL